MKHSLHIRPIFIFRERQKTSAWSSNAHKLKSIFRNTRQRDT